MSKIALAVLSLLLKIYIGITIILILMYVVNLAMKPTKRSDCSLKTVGISLLVIIGWPLLVISKRFFEKLKSVLT